MKRVCQNVKRLLVVVVSFFLLGYVNAQVTVTGVVTDGSFNEPMIGANVIEKGTTNGTVTDFDGKYTITVSSKDAELEFSYIGYVTQTIKVGDQTSISITIYENVKELQEVVKIGYGVAKKEDVTSAITTLGDDDIKDRPVLGVDQALQGKAAGVQVRSNSGTPGGEMQINIRGISSLNNSSPLYVVDGVPQTDIKGLNNSDIASISILKDASACAIYGARGANGVIIITTKGGGSGSGVKKESISVDFSSYRGVQSAWRRVDVMNAEEYGEYYNNMLDSTVYEFKDGAIYKGGSLYNPDGDGTDWQEEVLRNAIIQNYYIGLSGGGERSSFAASLGWFDQEGIIRTTDYNRLNARIKADHKLFDRVRVGEQIGFNKQVQNVVNQGSMWDNILANAVYTNPCTPVFDTSKYYNEKNRSGYASEQGKNPVLVLNEYSDTKETYGFGGDAYLEIDLLKGLTYKALFHMSVYGYERNQYNNEFYVRSDFQNSRNLVKTMFTGYGSMNNHTLTYNKQIYAKKDDGTRDSSKIAHGFNVVLGTEKVEDFNEEFSVKGYGLWSDEDYLMYPHLADRSEYVVENYQGPKTWTLASYLGRVEYNFMNKYNVNASLRRDGSSKFGDEMKWGTFPSFGAAWKIHKENFFKNSEALRFINSFKLRAGWGKIGNSAAAGAYDWSARMTQTSFYNFGGGSKANEESGEKVIGANLITSPTDDIHWEASQTTNIGVDFEFIKSKILFSCDYFNKQTQDMILNQPIVAISGFDESPKTNSGKMENKGFEFYLSYRKQEGTFHYSVSANLSIVDNVITEMGGTGEQQAGYIAPANEYAVMNKEGYDVGAFYGYVVNKENPIYDSWEQINDGPKNNLYQASPGTVNYVDINKDGVIDGNDKTIIGSPVEDFSAGLSFNCDWKGIDFAFSLSATYGNEIFNAVKYFTDNDLEGYNQHSRKIDSWTYTNDSDIAKADLNNQTYNVISDKYIEDGSFIRMKDITLGYTIPEKYISKLKIQNLRIYVQSQNLFTITNYSGFDPEVGNNPDQGYDPKGAKGFELGIDRGTYPQPRSFIFGLSLTL